MNTVLRVLIIEDSEDDYLLEMHALKQSGYDVYALRVATDLELNKALSKNQWDLILSDYSMPYLSGIEALHLVRAHDKNIPFIIVSGVIGEEKAVSAIKDGANDYVNKRHLLMLPPIVARVLDEQSAKQESEATKRALEETKERLFHAFHHTGTGVALLHLNLSFMEINASFSEMLGYTADELLHMSLNELIDESSKKLFQNALSLIMNRKLASSQVELRLIHKNAQKLWVVLNVSLVKHNSTDKSPYLIINFQDRTEQRYFEEKLLFLSTYDSLTGLLNRNSLFNKINELIQIKPAKPFSLYYVNVDRFKRVNETFGTYLGDYLLKNIATQLKNRIMPHELIGYLGGNEFLIINTQPTGEQETMTHGNFICSALLEPFLMQNTALTLTASVGICSYPKEGKTIAELLKTANRAVSESKSKGGNCCSLYQPGLNAQSSNHLIIESDLRTALADKELGVYFQPLINAHSGQAVGVEALIRWNKNGHLISPDEFIPIAEESSLILNIGEEVLRQACAHFSTLKKSSKVHIPARLSINLSSRQFANAQLIPTLKSLLESNELLAEELELEITETTLIQSSHVVFDIINQISEMGIQIAIDDFGTGYSSLGYLKNLPINRLKIDKSFIDSCMFDYNSQSIITSIISLAHRIGLKVTAEGVETLEQSNFLVQHHCDELQGFYFSPPLDPAQLIAFFNE